MARMTASKTSPPKFVEPWHAEVFALTLELSDNGHFSWVEWTETFGARLRAAAVADGPLDGSNYYDVWLETLEGVLVTKGLVRTCDMASMREAWKAAYLSTPHGAPVRLSQNR